MSFDRSRKKPGAQLRPASLASPFGFGLDPARSVVIELGTKDAGVVHGTEFSFVPPRQGTPIAFVPLSAVDSSGAGLVISGTPVLNTSRTDNMLGITVQYDLAHTQPYMSRYHSTTVSVPNAGAATALFDTQVASRGNVISYSAGTFTLAEAGTYLVTYTAAFQGGVTYIYLDAYVDWGSGPLERTEQYIPAPFTDGGYLVVASSHKATAGETFQCKANQQNAAAAARNLLSNSIGQTRISISRLYNDTLPTARVRGILIY